VATGAGEENLVSRGWVSSRRIGTIKAMASRRKIDLEPSRYSRGADLSPSTSLCAGRRIGAGAWRKATPFPARHSHGVIGVSVLTLTNPFFKEIGDSLTAEAAPHGYEVRVLNCPRKSSSQLPTTTRPRPPRTQA
jgi:hypothetical protein